MPLPFTTCNEQEDLMLKVRFFLNEPNGGP